MFVSELTSRLSFLSVDSGEYPYQAPPRNPASHAGTRLSHNLGALVKEDTATKDAGSSVNSAAHDVVQKENTRYIPEGSRVLGWVKKFL